MYNDKQKTLLTGTVSMSEIPKDTEVNNKLQIIFQPYKNVGLGISVDDSSISDISVANAQINGLGNERELQRRNMQENQNQKDAIRREQQRLKYQQLQSSYNADNNSTLTKINVSKKGNNPLDAKQWKNSILEEAEASRKKLQNRADLLYGGVSLTENLGSQESQIKKPDNSQINIQISQNEKAVPDISNPDKLLFANGLLSEMPLIKEFDLDKFKDEFIKHKDKLQLDAYILDKVFKELDKKIDEEIRSNYSGIRRDFLLKLKIFSYVSYAKKYYKMLKKDPAFLNELLSDMSTEELEKLLENYMNGDLVSLSAAHASFGEDAANLTRLNSKGFNINDNSKYYEHAEFFKTAEELPEKYRDVIKDKLRSQNLPADSKGIVFYKNSILANHIINSREFSNFINNNVSTSIAEKPNNDLSIEFKNMNLYFGIHKADIKNLKLNSKNNLTGDLIDTTDYNENDTNKVVQTARLLQEKEKIDPKFIIVNFELTPLKLREILKTKEK